jgi:signal transduction histidine kinase
MNQIIVEVIALAGSQIRGKGVSLGTQLSEGLPLIRGEQVQLQQVILNLVVNAIEAMGGVEGPRELLISSRVDGLSSVEVVVHDSGPGLDSGKIQNLFDAFYTTKSKGLGMGLAISRSIIEAHGGRLSAVPNVKRGATFQFSLPVGENQDLAAGLVPEALSSVSLDV